MKIEFKLSTPPARNWGLRELRANLKMHNIQATVLPPAPQHGNFLEERPAILLDPKPPVCTMIGGEDVSASTDRFL